MSGRCLPASLPRANGALGADSKPPPHPPQDTLRSPQVPSHLHSQVTSGPLLSLHRPTHTVGPLERH